MSIPRPSGPQIKTFAYRTGTKIAIIRDKLQGYVGDGNESPGAAVISELLQNADDAEATEVRFHFFDGYLEVRNNSYFKPEDFTHIEELMAAGKAEKRETIGAFGTGFIATYHLTDNPELLSMGQHRIFDPTKDDPPVYETDVQEKTIFRFPWRMEKTDLSKKIGDARVWTEEDIEIVKRGIGATLYRLSLFLRHVRLIEVYEGNALLLARVEHKPPTEQWQVGTIHAERKLIICEGDGIEPASDAWIYYKKRIECDLDLEDVTVKDNTVTIAFPITSRPWFKGYVPASIYNFLPTAIHTDFTFQINGAFFSDNNRRGILLDRATQPKKVGWNEQVIAKAGAIFVEVAHDIRDRVDTASRFYDLFPLTHREGVEPLKVVKATFIKALPNLEIIQSSRDSWLRPAKIILRDDTDLTNLAEAYLDLLPKGAPKGLQQALNELGCVPLTLDDVLNVLEPTLVSGARLECGSPHPMIDSETKLEWLYKGLERIIKSTVEKKQKILLDRVRSFAIFLAEDGCLYNGCLPDALWCGNHQVRELVGVTSLIRFVSRKLEERFPVLRDILRDLSGSLLLDHYIKPVLEAITSLPVTDSKLPTFMRGPDAFKQTLRVLADDLERLNQEALHHRPLVLDGAGVLRAASSTVRWPVADDRELLERIGLPFVDARLAEDDQLWPLYKKAGVRPVGLTDVIAALEQCYREPSVLADPDQIGALYELFEYLHRHVGKLEKKDADALMGRLSPLAIFPTRGGWLASAVDAEPLMIASEADERSLTVLCDVLELDVLINADVLRGNVPEFLTSMLGIVKLTPPELLRHYVLDRYHNRKLHDANRLALLDFVRALHADPKHRQAVEDLLKRLNGGPLSLVRYCDDSDDTGYTAPAPIYLDTTLTRTVLIDGFLRPHAQYDATWESFLVALGVARQPPVNKTAQRLIVLAESGAVPPVELYAALVERWNLLSKEIKHQLGSAAIFWNGQALWDAQQVMFDEQDTFFGTRRAYREQLQATKVCELLDLMLPQPTALGWRDHLQMIEEIAESYASGTAISADDHPVLIANVARIKPALVGEKLTGLDEAFQKSLRMLPVVLTKAGHLCAVDGHVKRLMIAAGPGVEADIPPALLDQIELVDAKYAANGGYLLCDLLGIEPIRPYNVVRDTFTTVYAAHEDAKTRHKLLSFLQRLWDDDLSNPQKKGLVDHLSHVPLIRADDDLYYRPELISFDTNELDAVFGIGPFRPRRPHRDYGIPKRGGDVTVWEQSPWIDLFCRLGVALSPAPADLLAAVTAVRARNTRPSQADSQAMQPLYNWVRSNISKLDTKDGLALLQQLAGLDWLPGKHAAAWGWYRPEQVYAVNDGNLVGTQAPILRFEHPNAGMQEQLRFPKEPPASIVADNLLHLSQQKQTEKLGTPNAIYAFLGRHWDELDSQRQQLLRQRPVIWYEDRFWEPTKTLFFPDNVKLDKRGLFGHRRALLHRSSDAQDRFFSAVCRAYHPLQSHIALLQEIAAEYTDKRQLNDEDHALLIGNFNYLGGENRDVETDTTLKSMAIIPGSDRALHRFDSIVLADSAPPELLRRFRQTSLMTVADRVQSDVSNNADAGLVDRSHELSLTKDGFRLLRDLGVQLLSLDGVVSRKLITVSNASVQQDITERIQALIGPFRRIFRTLKDKGAHILSDESRLNALARTNFVKCTKLTVQYVVTLPSGVEIEAPSPSNELALFKEDDTGRPTLYGREWDNPRIQTALALELELVFFLGGSVSTVIERLLGFRTPSDANDYLSLHRFLSERGEEPPVSDADTWDDDVESEDFAAYTDILPEDAEQPAEEEPAEHAAPPTSATSEPAGSATPTSAAHTTSAASPGNGHTPAAHVSQNPTLPTPSSGAGATNRAQAQVPPVAASSNASPQQRGADPKPQPGRVSNREWVPECSPDEAPLRTRPFQPTQRAIRANGQAHGEDHLPTTGGATSPTQAAKTDTAQNQLSHASRQVIGEWGERYVLRHLCDTMRKRYPEGALTETNAGFSITNGGVVVASACWLNTGGSEGVGHDIRLCEGQVEHIIEVKSTIESQKEWLQVSEAQWEFARRYGACYHIYRVFSATTRHAIIEIITDPVACWQRGELRLDPLWIYV